MISLADMSLVVLRESIDLAKNLLTLRLVFGDIFGRLVVWGSCGATLRSCLVEEDFRVAGLAGDASGPGKDGAEVSFFEVLPEEDVLVISFVGALG